MFWWTWLRRASKVAEIETPQLAPKFRGSPIMNIA
jgi:hypothetical protein